MDNAFSPREIQARIRSGASVSDVVSESGLDVARVEAFIAGWGLVGVSYHAQLGWNFGF